MYKKGIAILLVFSIVVAIVVSGLIYRLVQEARSGRAGADSQPMIMIVVAARDLGPGTRLEASDLKLVPWTATALPDGYFTGVPYPEGRALLTSVVKNEPVLERKLAPLGVPAGLASRIAPGQRAVSVRVNEVSSVAGFTLPDARVDVLAVANDRHRHDPVAKTLLQNIRVLAAGQKTERDTEGKPVNVTVVTLLVSPEEAEKLTLAGQEGKIQLALRNPLDGAQGRTRGAQWGVLLGGDRSPERSKTHVTRGPLRPATRVEIIAGSKKMIQEF